MFNTKRISPPILLLAATLGCDTVAEITFNEERLAQWYVAGTTPLSCEQSTPCPAQAQCQVVIFSLQTTLNETLRPQQTLKDLPLPLEPGSNFTADNFSIHSAWLFQVTQDGTDTTCTDNSDCLAEFQCTDLASMQLQSFYYVPQKYCAAPANISLFAAPNFTHFKQNFSPQNPLSKGLNYNGYSLALAIDNAATLDGSDTNGVPNPSSASDPNKIRLSALSLFASALYDAKSSPLANALQSLVFLMNGTTKNGVTQPLQQWITQFSKFQDLLSNAYPHPGGKSPLWEAVSIALDYVQKNAAASYAKAVITFSANPPNPGSEDALSELQIKRQANPHVPLHFISLSTTSYPNPPNPQIYSLSQESCATSQFVQNPAQLPDAFIALAQTTASHWALPLAIHTKLPQKSWVRLAVSLSVELANTTLHYDAHRVQLNTETYDKRFLLYTP